MKAIAAVAIARGYSVEQTMASGLSMGIAVGFLTVTGLLGSNEDMTSKSSEGTGQAAKAGWGLMRWVPVPVVKGIQVGAGLSLCISAGDKMLAPLGWRGSWWGDGLGWAFGAAVVVLMSDVGSIRHGNSRVPAALIIFLVGLILATIRLHLGHHGVTVDLSIGPTSQRPFERLPSWPRYETFGETLSTALGQLPLTVLNSILAVTHLAGDLYPSGFPPAPSPGALGLSISAMNILGCVFGAMPACHGSGGLAGQYKFGAGSGASIIFLGVVKVALGLFAIGARDAERGMMRLLESFPKGLLGVMVIAAGVELAKVGATVNDGARDLWEELDSNVASGRQESDVLPTLETINGKRGRYRPLSERERKERLTVMLVTVALLLAFKNDGVGFIAGMAWHWALKGFAALERRRADHQTPTLSNEERVALLR
jgi:hypothetical protein